MNIKIARIKKGLTQKQLCEVLKISPNKLVELERGNYKNLTYALMIKIAKALNTTVQELFFSEQEE